MFIITKKSKTPNIVWDSSTNNPLCKFVQGVFETNDQALAHKLKEMGYFVEEKVVRPFDEMKVEQLKAYAVEHNIDLAEAKSKADILKIIQETKSKE